MNFSSNKCKFKPSYCNINRSTHLRSRQLLHMLNLAVRDDVMKQVEIWIQIQHLYFNWLQKLCREVSIIITAKLVSFNPGLQSTTERKVLSRTLHAVNFSRYLFYAKRFREILVHVSLLHVYRLLNKFLTNFQNFLTYERCVLVIRILQIYSRYPGYAKFAIFGGAPKKILFLRHLAKRCTNRVFLVVMCDSLKMF